jgi:hypothetical protein
MFAAIERVCPEPCFADLEFERAEVECVSSAGTRYTRYIPVGMPQIAPNFLDSVIYLYRNGEDAKAGKNFGGTGFLVTLPDETYPHQVSYFYAVTNWHVACRGDSTIRVNNVDGSVDVFEFGPDEWHFSTKYDVAVIPMPFNASRLRAAMLPTQMFVTEELFRGGGPLGVGSDVFMIGRFIDHDGGQTNRPAARFGHVSVLPAPIIQPNRVKADSFCVDMHSRTGHSGSPVFVYRTPRSEIGWVPSIEHGAYLGLLGIHWGQFPELWEIEKSKMPDSPSEAGTLILEGQYVKGLSGMTCVLPAWSILEVLRMPKLTGLRREHTTKVVLPRLGLPPVAESASPEPDDANPDHLEDFKRLVDVAARKRPQGD